MWGRAIEAGILEDPWAEPPEEIFMLVKNNNIPAEYLELEFENGIPIGVDNRKMSLTDVITYLNIKAGKHGIGVIDHIEDRVVGIKTREIYEAPAAHTIIVAHKDLEQLVLTKHELRFKQIVDDQWSWMVYSGLWFDPLREDLDRFIDATQNRVTGNVKMKLQNGSLKVVGRKSKNSLYRHTLATYASDSVFDQNLAKGFIELWGMETVIANRLSKNSPTKSKGEKKKMKKECKDCGAELTIPQDSMVGEIITCPDCGTDFEIVSKNQDTVEMREAESVGEDWGQ